MGSKVTRITLSGVPTVPPQWNSALAAETPQPFAPVAVEGWGDELRQGAQLGTLKPAFAVGQQYSRRQGPAGFRRSLRRRNSQSGCVIRRPAMSLAQSLHSNT